MLGKGRLGPSGNTSKGRIGWLPMMAAASPAWRTGARLPGPASDSASGSASGSPTPCVAYTAGSGPAGELVLPCACHLQLMWRQPPCLAPEWWSPTLLRWRGPPACQYWYHSSLHHTLGSIFWEGSGRELNPAPSTNSSCAGYSLKLGSASTSSSG